MPGDPLDILISSNPKISSEDIQRLKKIYGLDQPGYVRYFKWLQNMLSGDLGYSRTYKIPVEDIVWSRILNTFYLSFAALLLSIFIAIPLGILSALKNETKVDYALNLLAFVGISIPSFFLAILLIIIFGVWLKWFPAGGTYTLGEALSGWAAFKDRAYYLTLPVLSLTFLQVGSFVRYTRGAMLEVLKADFVKTARSKGLSPLVIILKHQFRNALLPIVTVIGVNFSFIFSGSIITETVFSYQGVGYLIYQAIIGNDYNLAMVSFMISVSMVLFMSLITDIIYAFLDPRISYEQNEKA